MVLCTAVLYIGVAFAVFLLFIYFTKADGCTTNKVFIGVNAGLCIMCTFVSSLACVDKKEVKRETRYEVQVVHSYKNLVPLQTFEYLWIVDSCKCPKLARFREYLIMGKIDKSVAKREVRLVVHRHSYIRRYSQKGALKVSQIKREASILCQDDSGKNRIKNH